MPTFGLIPAAGKSVRMGRPKLLLPLAGRTVLARVLDAVRAGGVADVLTVVGADDAALAAAAAAAGAHVLQLHADTPDMRATCQRGLDWLEERFRPASDDGWLLLPADHPTVGPDVVRAVLDAAARHADRAVVVPAYRGRRGHPVWFRWAEVAAIRTLPAGQGLNVYVRNLAGRVLELPWPDPEVLRDLDTPEDYRRLQAEAGEAQ